MTNVRLIPALSILFVSITCFGAWAAPGLSKEVKLSAEREAIVMAPSWRTATTQPALMVLERAPDKSKQISFALLVLAMETGPESTDGIDWKKVRDNIVAAANAAGSPLSLELKEPFTAAKGLVGRHLSGTTKVKERTVKVEMIALVAPKVLLTISSVGRTDDVGVADLATKVATTARLTPAP
mgnify:CR=1 FL=1